MRTVWSILILALLLLSQAGSATAGIWMTTECSPATCATHAQEELSHCDASKGCGDAQGTQGSGHCHCFCHVVPTADLVSMTVRVIPGSRALALSKVSNETAVEGPAIGIDLPPQLL